MRDHVTGDGVAEARHPHQGGLRDRQPAFVAIAQLAETAALGIDVETLANRLQEDGLKQFEEAFDKLLAPLA